MFWDEQAARIPFGEIVEALFTADAPPLRLLYRLSDMQPDEFEQLAARWSQLNEERRRLIVRHLADISEDNFVVDFAPFFAFCFEDRHAPVRLAALDGVWDATDTHLIPPILRLLQEDPETAVRAAAAGALAHFVLMAEWGELPRHIAPPIVEALLAEYEKPDTAVSIKCAALEALGPAAHPRVAPLIEAAYESGDHALQASALFAMGGSADARWAPTLVDEMESPYSDLRAEAARAAGLVGGAELIGPLAELALEEDLDVARAAIVALGQIGGERVHAILARLAEDPEFVHLEETIEEAMDEMDWLSSGFESGIDLLMGSADGQDALDWDDEDDF